MSVRLHLGLSLRLCVCVRLSLSLDLCLHLRLELSLELRLRLHVHVCLLELAELMCRVACRQLTRRSGFGHRRAGAWLARRPGRRAARRIAQPEIWVKSLAIAHATLQAFKELVQRRELVAGDVVAEQQQRGWLSVDNSTTGISAAAAAVGAAVAVAVGVFIVVIINAAIFVVVVIAATVAAGDGGNSSDGARSMWTMSAGAQVRSSAALMYPSLSLPVLTIGLACTGRVRIHARQSWHSSSRGWFDSGRKVKEKLQRCKEQREDNILHYNTTTNIILLLAASHAFAEV
ncbi:hypothetical protein BX661DRAFT_206375 [Kickxella alabastrina]|uniref:uncharacterized protein n=1 Tax=Kickxella alabastrina TaxID=61397 RepID=UPI00222035CF|nr:uncharacterized protein BX661DRAFT_206375 [Kickxella alabastrina]KAI7825594.1 hypothetical protein BX661DRAFT_206375 [Kickxella alabastrina]